MHILIILYRYLFFLFFVRFLILNFSFANSLNLFIFKNIRNNLSSPIIPIIDQISYVNYNILTIIVLSLYLKYILIISLTSELIVFNNSIY